MYSIFLGFLIPNFSLRESTIVLSSSCSLSSQRFGLGGAPKGPLTIIVPKITKSKTAIENFSSHLVSVRSSLILTRIPSQAILDKATRSLIESDIFGILSASCALAIPSLIKSGSGVGRINQGYPSGPIMVAMICE